MADTFWLKPDGSVIVDGSGSPVLCDTCPCGPCPCPPSPPATITLAITGHAAGDPTSTYSGTATLTFYPPGSPSPDEGIGGAAFGFECAYQGKIDITWPDDGSPFPNIYHQVAYLIWGEYPPGSGDCGWRLDNFPVGIWLSDGPIIFDQSPLGVYDGSGATNPFIGTVTP